MDLRHTYIGESESTMAEQKQESLKAESEQYYLSKLVAQWAVGMRYEDLPQKVVDAATTFIIDHFGVVLGGTAKQSSRIIAELAADWSPANGVSTMVGFKRRSSPQLAALVNGTTGHCLELDDDHREGTQHPGVAIIPAA